MRIVHVWYSDLIQVWHPTLRYPRSSHVHTGTPAPLMRRATSSRAARTRLRFNLKLSGRLLTRRRLRNRRLMQLCIQLVPDPLLPPAGSCFGGVLHDVVIERRQHGACEHLVPELWRPLREVLVLTPNEVRPLECRKLGQNPVPVPVPPEVGLPHKGEPGRGRRIVVDTPRHPFERHKLQCHSGPERLVG